MVRAAGPDEQIIRALGAVHGVTAVQRRSTGTAEFDFYRVDTEPGVRIMNELARVIIDNGWQLREIRPVDITLEQIFIKLVTDKAEA
jgi:hypothetical protein